MTSVFVQQDWSHLPPEAFQPRHEITGHTTPPDRFDGTDHDALHIAAIESDITLPTPTETELREQYLNLSIDVSSLPSCPAHDFTPIVVELIRYFAEQVSLQATDASCILETHMKTTQSPVISSLKILKCCHLRFTLGLSYLDDNFCLRLLNIMKFIILSYYFSTICFKAALDCKSRSGF